MMVQIPKLRRPPDLWTYLVSTGPFVAVPLPDILPLLGGGWCEDGELEHKILFVLVIRSFLQNFRVYAGVWRLSVKHLDDVVGGDCPHVQPRFDCRRGNMGYNDHVVQFL